MSYKRFIIFKQQILSELTLAKVVFLVQEREIHNKLGILNSVLFFTIIGSRLVLYSVLPREARNISSILCGMPLPSSTKTHRQTISIALQGTQCLYFHSENIKKIILSIQHSTNKFHLCLFVFVECLACWLYVTGLL